MDKVNSTTRSHVMSTVHSKNTKLEQTLITLLESAGLTGFICHVQELPGKPDIVYMEVRVAVFLDSCFWHGCSEHLRMPSSNEAYWQKKIENNIKRDVHVSADLCQMGWSVVRVWEHDLKNSADVIERVKHVLYECGYFTKLQDVSTLP